MAVDDAGTRSPFPSAIHITFGAEGQATVALTAMLAAQSVGAVDAVQLRLVVSPAGAVAAGSAVAMPEHACELRL